MLGFWTCLKNTILQLAIQQVIAARVRLIILQSHCHLKKFPEIIAQNFTLNYLLNVTYMAKIHFQMVHNNYRDMQAKDPLTAWTSFGCG